MRADATDEWYLESEGGPSYLVNELRLEYATAHPDHPDLAALRPLKVIVGETEAGYVAARSGLPAVWFRLGDLPRKAALRLYPDAVRDINQQIVTALNDQGLIGVYIAPHPDDLERRTGRDLRPATETTLRLVVYTGRIRDVRTFASGDRIANEERADNPVHTRIIAHSPLQGGEGRSDLLRREELDRYVAYLNRHPGRRVDVALTPSQSPGQVYLDFLVAEERPWRVYAQRSDTGTDDTGEYRNRFGLVHNQLSGHDDILRLDFITDEFGGDFEAWVGSYSAPLWGTERTRWEVQGLSSEFDASLVGFGDAAFKGEQFEVGGDLVHTFFQRGDFFLDAVAGARWLDVESTNLGFTGQEDFFIPRLGLRMERLRETSLLIGGLGFEMNLADVAGTSSEESELFLLGRPEADDEWQMLRWDFAYSTYLEPLIDPIGFANPRSPSNSTLAHEVYVSTRGQYAFDHRLVPQQKFVLGGLHSVRGYPQAILSGDTVFLFTGEYRYHVPRAFDLQPEPAEVPILGAFRVAPQQVFGRPDWDLIVRTFIDAGHAMQSNPTPGEEDETLMGAGLGLELVFRRNLSARMDWAMALSDVGEEVEAGDSETNFMFTLLY